MARVVDQLDRLLRRSETHRHCDGAANIKVHRRIGGRQPGDQGRAVILPAGRRPGRDEQIASGAGNQIGHPPATRRVRHRADIRAPIQRIADPQVFHTVA